MDGFSGGEGGSNPPGSGKHPPPPPPPPPGSGKHPPPPQGRVNTPKKIGNPPVISLIFNISNYSLDYFTTMKLF